MQAFPDLNVTFDKLTFENGVPCYHWTLRGTYAPTGRAVCISGFEKWTLSVDGAIQHSEGNFDEAEYRRQTG